MSSHYEGPIVNVGTEGHIDHGKASASNRALSFHEWKRELHLEDVLEVGKVVHRPEAAYHQLYQIYRDESNT